MQRNNDNSKELVFWIDVLNELGISPTTYERALYALKIQEHVIVDVRTSLNMFYITQEQVQAIQTWLNGPRH